MFSLSLIFVDPWHGTREFCSKLGLSHFVAQNVNRSLADFKLLLFTRCTTRLKH